MEIPLAMHDDLTLRQQLVSLLTEGNAHVNFDAATKDLPTDKQGIRPEGGEHSPWELLEHLRIAQWDILEFSRNPQHRSPEWPKGYWPQTQVPPNAEAWEESAATFKGDLKEFVGLVMDQSIDLFAKISHGEGQTILREALLVADHNAYHVGQLVLVRKLLGAWT